MKLYNISEMLKTEYKCQLTKELDSLAKLNENDYYDFFYHYIQADELCKKEKYLAIRVPGGTVGGMWIDDNNRIIKIIIDTDYVVSTYPDNVNELIQKFVGEIIEW